LCASFRVGLCKTATALEPKVLTIKNSKQQLTIGSFALRWLERVVWRVRRRLSRRSMRRRRRWTHRHPLELAFQTLERIEVSTTHHAPAKEIYSSSSSCQPIQHPLQQSMPPSQYLQTDAAFLVAGSRTDSSARQSRRLCIPNTQKSVAHPSTLHLLLIIHKRQVPLLEKGAKFLFAPASARQKGRVRSRHLM
jgi:hypothetical protein